MIYIEPNLYVRVVELTNGPLPQPSRSGFSSDVAYRVLGIFSASESAECFFVLSNDRSETWFISNRHFRVVGILPDAQGALTLPLSRVEETYAAASDLTPHGHMHAPLRHRLLAAAAE